MGLDVAPHVPHFTTNDQPITLETTKLSTEDLIKKLKDIVYNISDIEKRNNKILDELGKELGINDPNINFEDLQGIIQDNYPELLARPQHTMGPVNLDQLFDDIANNVKRMSAGYKRRKRRTRKQKKSRYHRKSRRGKRRKTSKKTKHNRRRKNKSVRRR